MSILKSTVNTKSESFMANRDFYLERIKDLQERRPQPAPLARLQT